MSRVLNPWVFALLVVTLPWTAAAQGPEFVFTPEAVERTPPSRTLQQALTLYERRDFYGASILLQRIIDDSVGSVAHRQQAEFYLGKTLYHLGLYAASLSAFDRIIERGEAHRYLLASLKWLAALSRKLPETAGILRRVGRFTAAHLEQPALPSEVRSELRYLLGRHHYNEGRFEEAIDLFAAVGASSPHYGRAKFLEAVAQVRLERGEPAAAALSAVLALPGARHRRLREKATLALARVLYAMGQFDRSLATYDRIRRDSSGWLEALLESSWTHFQLGRFPQALGNLHTVGAPYFESRFFPEAHILQAVIYWKHCEWQRSRQALQAFDRRYPPLKRQIDALLARHRDPAELYAQARQIQRGTSGLAEEPARLARLALEDRSLDEQMALANELERELERLAAADPAWRATRVAGGVLQDLSLQRSLVLRDAGLLVGQRLRRVSREIQQLTQQAYKVQYETIRGEREELEAGLRGELLPPGEVARIEVDDEHLFWPFEGPYWRDELGYYRVRVGSQCKARPRSGRGPSAMAVMRLRDTPLDEGF